MEILIILVFLIILIAPSFLMMRKQKAHQRELKELQDSLRVGDRVVTAAGVHAVVVGLEGGQVALEVTPGVVTTWERIAIIKRVEEQHPENVAHPSAEPAAEPPAAGETAATLAEPAADDPAAATPGPDAAETAQAASERAEGTAPGTESADQPQRSEETGR
ncbi:preprotein translocase subunit YajC [Corynebacterium atypicum]|uniref:preprotein translocase subunit YajC n=1 Tax=Corynebacterium atypicum TaxID=191610 RepID=UPI0006900A46|nr:preprotein translocase subunit YajC [Corynebacterium atypicum]